MRGIAGKKDASDPPAFGEACMEVVDHLAHDRQSGVFVAVAAQQRADIRLVEKRFRIFARQHHELVAASAFRAGQRESGPGRIAEHARVPERIGRAREIDDEPALVVGAAAHLDAQCLADSAAAAIAGGDVLRMHLIHRTIDAGNLGAHGIAVLLQVGHLRREARFRRGKARQPLAELRLEHGLPECRPTRIAVLHRFGKHLREALAARREIVRAVTLHDGGAHRVDEIDVLHRPQRFVVDRDGARFADGGGVALDDERADAVHPEDVGQREARRAGADNQNFDVRVRHGVSSA